MEFNVQPLAQIVAEAARVVQKTLSSSEREFIDSADCAPAFLTSKFGQSPVRAQAERIGRQ
jgi:hypothetical protein